jgi:hypothetical protein
MQPANEEMMLLGELSARVDSDARPGERCVVWPIATDGRKRFAGSHLRGRRLDRRRAGHLDVVASLER